MDARRLLGGFVIASMVVGSSADLAPHAMAAGQAGWSSNSATQTTTYDRYGQPINTAPSISQRGQTAFNDSTNAIRDGVEAGIRSANNQISQAANGVGTQVNQQAQSWSNSAVNGVRTGAEQAANSFTSSPNGSNVNPSSSRSGVSSPWTTSSSPTNSSTRGANAVTSANGGWTSIGTGIAAPPLLVPQSPMTNSVGTTTNFGNAGGTTNRPTIPIAASNEQPTMHSVLTDPARSDSSATSNSASNEWGNNWNNPSNSPPSIGRPGSQIGSTARDSDLVPLQGSNTANLDPRSVTTARQTDNWGDSWGQPAQNSPPATIGSASTRPANSNVSSPFGNQPIGNQANGQLGTAANSQPLTGPALGGFNPPLNNPTSQLPNNPMANNPMPNSPMAGGQMPNGQLGPNPLASNTMGASQFGNSSNQSGRVQFGNGSEQQPWVPFIGAVLIMAFSLAANLYLGVSYLDARQKYQSLVRKTAETFRRVKVAA